MVIWEPYEVGFVEQLGDRARSTAHPCRGRDLMTQGMDSDPVEVVRKLAKGR